MLRWLQYHLCNPSTLPVTNNAYAMAVCVFCSFPNPTLHESAKNYTMKSSELQSYNSNVNKKSTKLSNSLDYNFSWFASILLENFSVIK